MTVQITTTETGKFEHLDLNQLPLINGVNPLQLAAEGKLSSHELYRLLAERRVPNIDNSMGVQTLCMHWMREINRLKEVAIVRPK